MLSIMEWCTSVIDTRACRDTRQVHGRQSCGRRARPKATLQVTSVQRNHWARLPDACVLSGGAVAESARRRSSTRTAANRPHRSSIKQAWHPPAQAVLRRRPTTACPTRAASSRPSRRPASRRCPRRTTSRASSRRRRRLPRRSSRPSRRRSCRCCSVRVRNTHCILTTATSPSARRRAGAQT